MATTMAAARQPFAPIEGSRLSNLTSLKNRQNALSNLSSPTKRKATTFEDDAENVDPIIFLSPKKSKSADGSSKDTIFQKPVNYFLTKAPASPDDFSSSFKPTPPRRAILTARSPAPRLNTNISKSTPLSAPAGRSPTRKRIGILNRRRTTSAFTRIEPPQFNKLQAASSSSSLGFSIDAALSGTIPSYKSRSKPLESEENTLPIPLLHTPQPKEGWFFSIHEDTEEELATNLMEHSTCTLDISSDEESAAREKDNRGKENVPPVDDVSQTRTQFNLPATAPSEMAECDITALKAKSRRRRDVEVDENAIEIDRSALGELLAEDFYADGCDGESVWLVPGEEDEDGQVPISAFEFSAQSQSQAQPVSQCESGSHDMQVLAQQEMVLPELLDIGADQSPDIDELMRKNDFEVPKKAALLMPIEKAEDGFEVWESGSAKGDTDEC